MRIIIPRGTINAHETAVINIPQRLLNKPVLRAVRSERNIVLDATSSVQGTNSLGILNPSQMSTQASESLGLLGAPQSSPNDAFVDWRTPATSRTYSIPDSNSLGMLDPNQMRDVGFLEADRPARRPQRRGVMTSTSWTRVAIPGSADESMGALRPGQLDEAFNASDMGDQMDMGFLEDTQNNDSLGLMEPALMNSGRSSAIAGEQTRVEMFLSQLEEMEFNTLLDPQRS